MRKVHANNVQSVLSQFCYLCSRVCLGAYLDELCRVYGSIRLSITNCANDGGTAIVSGGLVLRVQLGEPFDSRPSSIQMIKGVGHVCDD
jgi:hypothetical protein